jgi:GT2 family glycosyltransferase
VRPSLAGRITVIVPAYNAAPDLRLCLAAVRAGDLQPVELLVADDGSTDATAAVAREFGAVVISTGGPLGPARARNLAARHASGPILVFFDADVVPHAATVGKLGAALEADAELDAIIGAYDDAPACGDFLSQYKNLQHCFIHRTGLRTASTFWTGCGAVRREVFLAHGGFLESYAKPSIEDVEFGTRLVRAGRRIVLDPSIQVKHLKRWTFRGLLKTEIFQRAVPWTELILREGRLPNDLNLAGSQRLSAAAALLGVLATAVGTWIAGPRFLAAALGAIGLALTAFWIESPRRQAAGAVWLGAVVALWWAGARLNQSAVLPALAVVLTAVGAFALNLGFFRFLAGRRGFLFALAATQFFLLYLIYSSVTFALVMMRDKLSRRA